MQKQLYVHSMIFGLRETIEDERLTALDQRYLYPFSFLLPLPNPSIQTLFRKLLD